MPCTIGTEQNPNPQITEQGTVTSPRNYQREPNLRRSGQFEGEISRSGSQNPDQIEAQKVSRMQAISPNAIEIGLDHPSSYQREREREREDEEERKL